MNIVYRHKTKNKKTPETLLNKITKNYWGQQKIEILQPFHITILSKKEFLSFLSSLS